MGEMADALAFAGLLQFVAAALFLTLGWRLWRRPTQPAERPALNAFAMWWACLGMYMAVQGSAAVMAGLGAAHFGVFLAFRLYTIPLLCIGTGGLTYYLFYLYTGRGGLLVPVGSFFLLVMVAFYWVVVTHVPSGLPDNTLLAEITYAQPLGGPVYLFVLLGIGLPPIVGSFALLGLRRHLAPHQRYRITMVAAGILTWVGSGLVARLMAGDLLVFLTLVGGGLVAALLAWFAYHPPTLGQQADRGSRPAPDAGQRPEARRRVRRAVPSGSPMQGRPMMWQLSRACALPRWSLPG